MIRVGQCRIECGVRCMHVHITALWMPTALIQPSGPTTVLPVFPVLPVLLYLSSRLFSPCSISSRAPPPHSPLTPNPSPHSPSRKHIMVSYVGALFFFVLQSIFAFFIIDNTPGVR